MREINTSSLLIVSHWIEAQQHIDFAIKVREWKPMSQLKTKDRMFSPEFDRWKFLNAVWNALKMKQVPIILHLDIIAFNLVWSQVHSAQ